MAKRARAIGDTFQTILLEVDREDAVEPPAAGPRECVVCFCESEDYVECQNPRKRRAICKACFSEHFKRRGTGPFANLTVAQAARVHANPHSGADE